MNGEDLGAIYPVGATFNQQNELTLGVPNPFSIYKGGEQSAIWWQNSASISRINIYFSSDDGNSWQTLQMNVDASQKGMAWTIPNLYSSKCRVKIESATNPLISAQNVLPFVILPPTDSTGLPEFSIGSGYYDPVSYTHLRAHETVLDLVCRLLLEKKKTQIHHLQADL